MDPQSQWAKDRAEEQDPGDHGVQGLGLEAPSTRARERQGRWEDTLTLRPSMAPVRLSCPTPGQLLRV